jgi:hypothetical protein
MHSLLGNWAFLEPIKQLKIYSKDDGELVVTVGVVLTEALDARDTFGIDS